MNNDTLESDFKSQQIDSKAVDTVNNNTKRKLFFWLFAISSLLTILLLIFILMKPESDVGGSSRYSYLADVIILIPGIVIGLLGMVFADRKKNNNNNTDSGGIVDHSTVVVQQEDMTASIPSHMGAVKWFHRLFIFISICMGLTVTISVVAIFVSELYSLAIGWLVIILLSMTSALLPLAILFLIGTGAVLYVSCCVWFVVLGIGLIKHHRISGDTKQLGIARKRLILGIVFIIITVIMSQIVTPTVLG